MLKIDIESKSRYQKMKKKVIVKDIHLELESGTSTLMLGTSGAGKSTIISCITGNTRFRGRVRQDKQSRIAYIAQHPALNMNETVCEAIYYSGRYDHPAASRKSVQEETERLMKMLGLEDIQYNKIKNISGGQLKRTAIACELIRETDVLILDEPDSGLDAGVSWRLSEHIRDLTHYEKKTTLVISHNTTNISHYDNLLVLAKDSDKAGSICYFGSPAGALSWFSVSDYYEILLEINSKEDEGRGRGAHYIEKYKEAYSWRRAY